MEQVNNTESVQSYSVWDPMVRWFHWINVLLVLALIIFGTLILNAKLFGILDEGKILLKTIHVYIGYIFAINLMIRLVWAFIGNRFARWSSITPFGKHYWRDLFSYLKSIFSKQPKHYLGHNPIAKLMVSLLLLMLSVQMVTGLILASTDLYMPPLGNQVAAYIIDDPMNIDLLQPGSKQYIDKLRYDDMRAMRKPIIITHYYAFYALISLIILHILAVIISEVREKTSLISAMFNGRKVMSVKPEDE